ncbi:hypothetical protein MSAS_14380 [Mycobacterium saskatchewanense]|nr:hypothetical protein MSAS_14380 [Mycobacterium saskatchewanense]
MGVDVAATAGVVRADAALLPGDTDHAIGDRPAVDPLCAGAIVIREGPVPTLPDQPRQARRVS